MAAVVVGVAGVACERGLDSPRLGSRPSYLAVPIGPALIPLSSRSRIRFHECHRQHIYWTDVHSSDPALLHPLEFPLAE